MRFAPAAAVLSLALAMTASVGWSAERDPDPRAAMLIAEGQTALQGGDVQGAIDAYEAALVVDPGYTPLYLRLAEAARADRMQGKAISYYREVLNREPRNYAAMSAKARRCWKRARWKRLAPISRGLNRRAARPAPKRSNSPLRWRSARSRRCRRPRRQSRWSRSRSPTDRLPTGAQTSSRKASSTAR